MGLSNYFFLRSISRRFRRILRKHYSRRQTKYNLRLVRALYTNIGGRYGMTAKQLYKCLPLKLKIDPDIDGYAYGVCQVRDCYMKKSKWRKKMVNCSKATICLQKADITSTTFIHEFGHYLRYLIGIVSAFYNNQQAIKDFGTICSIVGNHMRIGPYMDRRFFIFGFKTEQEELFARSWEQYMKDGVAPSKEYIKLFKDFRMDIVMDGHSRDERRKFENYEDLSDSFITPQKKKFFSELIVGKKLKINFFREFINLLFYTAIFISIMIFIEKLLNTTGK